MHPAGDAGVVDHDVERAELLHRERHQVSDLVGFCSIALPENRFGAMVFGERGASAGIDVGDHHVGALGEELLDDSCTDPRRAAGDDRDFAGKFVDHTDELIGGLLVKSSD